MLLRLYASLLDDAPPFVDLARHVGAELRGAHVNDVGAFGGEQLLHLGRIENFGNVLVQPCHDGLRGPAGRHEADPVRRLVAGYAGFGHRRHVRQGRAARHTADAKGTELAGANVHGARGHRAERHLGVAADHVNERRARTAKWDMQNVDIGGDLEG